MNEKKFDPIKLQRLNDPQRLETIRPDYIWDKLDIDTADVLVEIGAGTAFFSTAFLKKANASKVMACDISDVLLDWVKEHVLPKHPGVVPVKTEEECIPLDDGIADLVFMINLHHELHQPLSTLKEAYRMLKPGGKVFIVDWKMEEMTAGPPAHIRCLPEHVKKQLEDVGFRDVNVFNELPTHFLVVGEKE